MRVLCTALIPPLPASPAREVRKTDARLYDYKRAGGGPRFVRLF